MRPSVVLALVAIIPLSAACAVVGGLLPGGQGTAAPLGEGQIEPIHAAAIAQDQAVFWVSSNGCTSKADLNPVVRRAGDASVITLRRLKEDRCSDARPEGVEMRWSFQELGLSPGARVSIENPYQLTPSG